MNSCEDDLETTAANGWVTLMKASATDCPDGDSTQEVQVFDMYIVTLMVCLIHYICTCARVSDLSRNRDGIFQILHHPDGSAHVGLTVGESAALIAECGNGLGDVTSQLDVEFRDAGSNEGMGRRLLNGRRLGGRRSRKVKAKGKSRGAGTGGWRRRELASSISGDSGSLNSASHVGDLSVSADAYFGIQSSMALRSGTYDLELSMETEDTEEVSENGRRLGRRRKKKVKASGSYAASAGGWRRRLSDVNQHRQLSETLVEGAAIVTQASDGDSVELILPEHNLLAVDDGSGEVLASVNLNYEVTEEETENGRRLSGQASNFSEYSVNAVFRTSTQTSSPLKIGTISSDTGQGRRLLNDAEEVEVVFPQTAARNEAHMNVEYKTSTGVIQNTSIILRDTAAAEDGQTDGASGTVRLQNGEVRLQMPLIENSNENEAENDIEVEIDSVELNEDGSELSASKTTLMLARRKTGSSADTVGTEKPTVMVHVGTSLESGVAVDFSSATGNQTTAVNITMISKDANGVSSSQNLVANITVKGDEENEAMVKAKKTSIMLTKTGVELKNEKSGDSELLFDFELDIEGKTKQRKTVKVPKASKSVAKEREDVTLTALLGDEGLNVSTKVVVVPTSSPTGAPTNSPSPSPTSK